eukprot:GHVR01052526.1.p1 GENE.GHVR01052526.1~~GHVR01052526.1.p1  ORF type:complete len:196 (+),score=42.90 GHVR01052526.1:876-1463(+)
MCKNRKDTSKVFNNVANHWGFSDESAQHCFVATQAESVLAVISDTNRDKIDVQDKVSYACTVINCLEQEMFNNDSEDCESCVLENVQESLINVSRDNKFDNIVYDPVVELGGEVTDSQLKQVKPVEDQTFVDVSEDVFVDKKEENILKDGKSNKNVDELDKPKNSHMDKNRNIEVLTTAKINNKFHSARKIWDIF